MLKEEQKDEAEGVEEEEEEEGKAGNKEKRKTGYSLNKNGLSETTKRSNADPT